MRSQGASEGGERAAGPACGRSRLVPRGERRKRSTVPCGSLSPLSENSATGTEMAAASPPSSVASSPGSCAGDQEDSARDGPHGRCGRRGPRGRVSHQSPGSEDLAHLIKRRLLSPVTSPLDRGGPGPGGCMAREPPRAPRGPTKSGNHSRGSRAPAPAVVGGEAGNRP